MRADIALVPMTRERMHAYFRRFVADADLFMDASQCRPYSYDAARVDAFFDKRAARRDAVWFAVLLGDAVIGDAGLKHIDAEKRECELSIHLVNDQYKNRGFGTAAEWLLLEHAFETLRMRAVLADATLKNARSQRVLEKLGFERVSRDETFVYYKLNADQYRKRRRGADDTGTES